VALFLVYLGIAGDIAGSQFVHFFACPKKRTKEKAPCVPCPAIGGMPCAPRCCRGFANSLRSNSANPLFGSLSGARLRANGNSSLPSPICPAASRPRREARGARRARTGWGAFFLFLLLGTQKKKERTAERPSSPSRRNFFSVGFGASRPTNSCNLAGPVIKNLRGCTVHQRFPPVYRREFFSEKSTKRKHPCLSSTMSPS